MKVLAILLVAVSSASALGSGPYLPSGWRPDGPAFFLPGEVSSKPSDNPIKETLFQESEGSSSNFFREYGPPKVQDVSQDITQQSLPDVVTEQSFVVIEAKFNEEALNEEVKETGTLEEIGNVAVTEVITEQVSAVAEELVQATEAQATVEVITTEQPNEEDLIQVRGVNLDIEESVPETVNEFVEATVVTEKELTENQAINTEIKKVEDEKNEKLQQEIVNNEVKNVVEDVINENVVQTVKVLEKVKNMVQEIIKIENEVAQEQAVEGSGLRSVQISGSLAQAPAGFLEYGPPGFREYGPPKGDELLRSSAVQEQSESQLIENNDARRRRYSSKFRSARKH